MTKCSNCDEEHELTICDGCAAERYVPRTYGDECDDAARDDELADVLEFFKQLEVDQLRCSSAINLQEIAARLERGEHRQ